MLSLKNDVNIPISKKYGKQKKLILLGQLESHCQKEQDLDPDPQISNPVYGSKDPDPYQNLTTPEH
jgi:hypothetical protein